MWNILSSPYRHFQKHTHNFSEAFILLSGSTVHLVEDRAYPVGKGCVCVLKGGHGAWLPDCENLEIINLMYDSRTFSAYRTSCVRSPGFDPLFLIEPEIRSHKEYPCSLIFGGRGFGTRKTLSDLAIDLLSQRGKRNIPLPYKCSFSHWSLFSFRPLCRTGWHGAKNPGSGTGDPLYGGTPCPPPSGLVMSRATRWFLPGI